MGAPSNYYVKPVTGNDTTGDGSSGTPWKTVQKALNTITRDATNGDQININSEGDDVLSAALTLATYGTPTSTAPLILRGYTTTANDGGKFGISGGGTVRVMNEAKNFIHLIDGRMHNCGTLTVCTLARFNFVENMKFENTTSNGLVLDSNAFSSVSRCYFANLGNVSVTGGTVFIEQCVFEPGGRNPVVMFDDAGNTSYVRFNFFKCAGATIAVRMDAYCKVYNNTIWCSAGTGKGIATKVDGSDLHVVNNYVEGFSGAGGVGINLTHQVQRYGYNKTYNNTTNFNVTGDVLLNLGTNDVLGASGIVSGSGLDFKALSDLIAVGYPTTLLAGAVNAQRLNIGAYQGQEPAGGGGGVVGSNMRGGFCN